MAALKDKPGIPVSSGDLAKILALMKTTPAKMILRAAYQNGKAAQWLSEKTAIPIVVLPFTVGGNDRATDLFSLYDSTFELLLAAYNK